MSFLIFPLYIFTHTVNPCLSSSYHSLPLMYSLTMRLSSPSSSLSVSTTTLIPVLFLFIRKHTMLFSAFLLYQQERRSNTRTKTYMNKSRAKIAKYSGSSVPLFFSSTPPNDIYFPAPSADRCGDESLPHTYTQAQRITNVRLTAVS